MDIKEVASFPGTFIHEDIAQVSADRLREALGGNPHLVLSDMAPHTVGDRFTDHVRQMRLAELARERAVELCAEAGRGKVAIDVDVVEPVAAHPGHLSVQRPALALAVAGLAAIVAVALGAALASLAGGGTSRRYRRRRRYTSAKRRGGELALAKVNWPCESHHQEAPNFGLK